MCAEFHYLKSGLKARFHCFRASERDMKPALKMGELEVDGQSARLRTFYPI